MSGNSHAWIADLTNLSHIISVTLLAIVFYIVISIAYFTYFHGIKGRTPGKMLLGLQVLSVEGTPIGFGTAFLRSVGYLVSSLLFTIPLGFIWAAFDKRKQGWHDKIAGTLVIIRSGENNTVGLTIPSEGEKQSETGSPAVVKSSEPTTGENKAMADQPGVNDQNIP